jgi:hypothetical protein
MREAVAYKTQSSLLNILFDWVERLLLANFHLRVGPTRNFDDHVEDAIILVGEERDVVEW